MSRPLDQSARESTPLLFKEQTAEELAVRLAPLGVTPRLARRLQGQIVKRGAAAVPETLAEVSPRLLAAIRSATRVPRLELVDKQVDPRDGFVKYLFRGQGEGLFEAVRIPLLTSSEAPESGKPSIANIQPDQAACGIGREGISAPRRNELGGKYVVCVSSQVGCPLACAFCATGKLGLIRNLATWEMVDQVVQVQADADWPVRGVVFMGMGEPLLNYDRVVRAAQLMTEPCGLAIRAKAISISTAGVAPMIHRLARERQPYRLVISLTSADPARRAELMPITATHSLDELRAAAEVYHQATGQRVMLAWTLISGLNTRDEDARQLAAWVRGLPIKLDLIDVSDPSGRFLPPTAAELASFRDSLRRHLGMPVARRYSGGQQISAGCGMLVGSRAGA